jgi:hypothetical protein
MRLPASVIAFVLAVLLISTTPVGTGAGTHQFDLLHPLFAHLHLINGRWLTHEELARASAPASDARPSPGPALAADGVASSGDGGLGVSPVGPGQVLGAILADTPVGFLMDEVRMPAGNEEAPPDPPPL